MRWAGLVPYELAYRHEGIVQVSDAVRSVKRRPLGLADGRHDLLLLRHTVADDVGDDVPLEQGRRSHLLGVVVCSDSITRKILLPKPTGSHGQ